MLGLYKISQKVVRGYDTYDSAVVVAYDSDEARMIHPMGGGKKIGPTKFPWGYEEDKSWASDPKDVEVEYLGELSRIADYKAGDIVVKSYRAG